MNEIRVVRFLKDLLNPEMYGHAVSAEVRDRARMLLDMKPVETPTAIINADKIRSSK